MKVEKWNIKPKVINLNRPYSGVNNPIGNWAKHPKKRRKQSTPAKNKETKKRTIDRPDAMRTNTLGVAHDRRTDDEPTLRNLARSMPIQPLPAD